MAKFDSYQKFDVWIQSKDLVKVVYGKIKQLPREEQFVLTTQLTRATISIPAEGCASNHYKDSIQLFYLSRGSLSELETHLAYELEYLSKDSLNSVLELINSCKRRLNGFINYLSNKGRKLCISARAIRA
jgi:four helix bundle protein